MIRSQFNGTFLILEGNKDLRVYERFTNNTECKLIDANGKDNAINTLNILEMTNSQGVLTIVDADSWRLNGIQRSSNNLLITDTHDLETMILLSGALEAVLSELGSTNRINRLGRPIRDMLINCALPIGYLRWISSSTQWNLNLKFKALDFNNFIDRRTLSVDIDRLIRAVKHNSKRKTLDINRLRHKILNLIKAEYDPWQVCSGHDIVEILSIGLSNIFGKPKARKYSIEALDTLLRIAYNYKHFCSTRLHGLIKDWEKTNPTYKVLSG